MRNPRTTPEVDTNSCSDAILVQKANLARLQRISNRLHSKIDVAILTTACTQPRKKHCTVLERTSTNWVHKRMMQAEGRAHNRNAKSWQQSRKTLSSTENAAFAPVVVAGNYVVVVGCGCGIISLGVRCCSFAARILAMVDAACLDGPRTQLPPAAVAVPAAAALPLCRMPHSAEGQRMRFHSGSFRGGGAM